MRKKHLKIAKKEKRTLKNYVDWYLATHNAIYSGWRRKILLTQEFANIEKYRLLNHSKYISDGRQFLNKVHGSKTQKKI